MKQLDQEITELGDDLIAIVATYRASGVGMMAIVLPFLVSTFIWDMFQTETPVNDLYGRLAGPAKVLRFVALTVGQVYSTVTHLT